MSRPTPSTWNDNREFERGQVFFVDFANERPIPGRDSRLIRGPHRVVVLFPSSFPRNTVVVVPISSLYDSSNNKKQTISSDVELYARDYPNGLISEDSFIMTNQITSVTRSRLERCIGNITPKDMVKLDIQLISTLSLNDTIQAMIEQEVNNRLSELGVIVEDEEA